MKKVAIFPYTKEYKYIFRFKELLDEYEISYLIKPKGLNEDNSYNQVIKITEDYQEAINNSEILILFDLLKDYYELYLEKINYAISRKKKVLVAAEIFNQLSSKVRSSQYICELSNEYLENQVLFPKEKGELYSIDIPIITVMGLGEDCEKTKMQLYLREHFVKKEKYNILQLGANEILSIFGIKQLPKFLYSKTLSLTDKIMLFNRFLYGLVLKEDYDAIIIGIPGGIMPANNIIHNFFGEIPYIVSQAFSIDINILCLYYNPFINEEFLKNMYECCKYRFGCITESFYISNTKYEFNMESMTADYFHMDNQIIKNNLKKYIGQYAILNSIYEDNISKDIEKIINCLANNLEIV